MTDLFHCLREGVRVAIVGKPNVGKSTLLNRLVQRPAAIVSALPGTTRDVIETRLDLEGYPIVIADTAGLRSEVQDIVEEEGVKRAVNAANEADVIVFVQDYSSADRVNFETFGLENNGQTCVHLVNKVDLLPLSVNLSADNSIGISGLTGQGVDKFLDELLAIVKELCRSSQTDSPGLTRERHRLHLQKAMECLEEYLDMDQEGEDLVISAHQLRKSVREIGCVSGQVSSDQILDVIFADFCIGK